MPKPVASAWIDTLYERKQKALEGIHVPRIVLVGGSGTHFSLSADRIHELTGLQAVNFGTHAGLGIEYILRRVMTVLKPGDTVVFTPEYQLLRDSPPSTVLTEYVATSDPNYLLKTSVKNVPPLLFGYSPWESLKQNYGGAFPNEMILYHGDAITPRGDETVNVPANRTPYMAATINGVEPILPYLYRQSDISASIFQFAEWAKDNHIGLIHAWPPMLDNPVYHTAEYGHFFENIDNILVSIGFSSAGNPLDYLLPADAFMDTRYHATIDGARRASTVLASTLCLKLSCK